MPVCAGDGASPSCNRTKATVAKAAIMLTAASIHGFFIGFESGSDRVLRFIRKGSTRAMNLEAARICRRLGLKVWANYMLGLPTETEDEVRDTISMLKEMVPD